MIEIYSKKDKLSLDLDPECVFEINIEQPLLDDTHLPVPFSTSISFPATLKNKTVFGFLGGALLIEPSVKKLEVDILADGLKIMTGILIYDGFEDGMLEYSFSGRNLEDDWSAKIWTQVNPATSVIPSSNTQEQNLAFLKAVKEGGHFMAAPLLVNQNAVAYTIHAAHKWAEEVDISVKYHNWPTQDNVIFTPVFRLRIILEKILKSFSIDGCISDIYQYLAIVAQYKPDGVFNEIGIPLQGGYDCQNMLPDLTVYQMVQNIARMFCAAVFRDGNTFRLLSARTVLESRECVDWSEKVSDEASVSVTKAQSYIFKYQNSDQDNSYDVSNLSEDLSDGDIVNAQSLRDTIRGLGYRSNTDDDTQITDEGLKAVRNAMTRDIYSGGYALVNRAVYLPLCDILYHHNPIIDTSTDEVNDSFDNSMEFNLVKCIPEYIGLPDNAYEYRMCPVISPVTIGASRNNDVYIGLLCNNQLVDKGLSFIEGYNDSDIGMSLAPDALYDRYHKSFAEWLAHDRQTVSAGLNLTMKDIILFRSYNKVRFHGRTWLVKRLTLTMSASSDLLNATGEFIAC